MKKDQGPSFFDIIEAEDIKANPESCVHPRNKLDKTITVWPGETCQRFTWTCQLCGKVWGRCP